MAFSALDVCLKRCYPEDELTPRCTVFRNFSADPAPVISIYESVQCPHVMPAPLPGAQAVPELIEIAEQGQMSEVRDQGRKFGGLGEGGRR